MSNEWIVSSLIILLFLGWFSLFPEFLQTYVTQMVWKGSCSPERLSLQAV